jgi:hypothetical protein
VNDQRSSGACFTGDYRSSGDHTDVEKSVSSLLRRSAQMPFTCSLSELTTHLSPHKTRTDGSLTNNSPSLLDRTRGQGGQRGEGRVLSPGVLLTSLWANHTARRLTAAAEGRSHRERSEGGGGGGGAEGGRGGGGKLGE